MALPSPIVIDVLIAAVVWSGGMAMTWRLVWPKWKIAGKGLFSLGVTAALSWWLGHWSLLFILLHSGLGIAFHLWWCQRHGFTWYAVEDPERYISLQKEWLLDMQDSAGTDP